MLGLIRFSFLSVITVEPYPVFLVLRKVGRTLAGSMKPKKTRSEVPRRDGELPLTTRSGTNRMRHDLSLVSLNEERIAKASDANGSRKRIAHALLRGPYGQMFGAEKQCLKYHLPWRDIFPGLFSRGVEKTNREFTEYRSTFDLVSKLIGAEDSSRTGADQQGSRAA